MTDPNLMSREEVAALLGIKPNSVRDTLRRHGITEQRGYPREAVENLKRPGRGYRSDLHTPEEAQVIKLQWNRRERPLREDPDGYPAAGARLTDQKTGATVIVLPRPDKWVPSYLVPIEWADTGVTDVVDLRRLVAGPDHG